MTDVEQIAQPKEYHVASFIGLIDMTQQHTVMQSIESTPGAEIHAHNEQGKVVFTIEADNQGVIGQLADQLKLAPGILSLSPVYHQYIEE
ncbi:chaperone NapD [Thalassotalea ponticola]|uniref:chaperone NapD n=1 Tax=Thalassotalea ponticola TaxID=1523392 RepID=UPI0025B2BE5D|nr:chaperone NapD [Thalassotalea ponticola]MDN3651888.1 chaperone NapD [Thalassotalea ponticola]